MKRVIRVRAHLRKGRIVRAHWMTLSESELEQEKAWARQFGVHDKRLKKPMEKMAIQLYHTWGKYPGKYSDEQRDEILEEYGKAYDEE